ncbi:multisubunit sodium/proton antiporter, MrpE subunit [Caminicella sporogenes DSM 14501]|uniref:Multisubunit sodium/proton antiporter, MrpE subunit n=1 Tax=Caminicella sporogenes DSM 14501 TaxID=1121266 RepID=A0A1M6NDG0_9FIRM|nr:Na+/H+ antiporter subunit E [Caminicella sporogenes]SHJ93751.1 multisubunit sodium/proton antiporter, MrpE subunit [Caminicella sporogenes DSM 14501]
MKYRLVNIIVLLIFLSFWLMLSEKIDIESLLIGCVISFAVYYLNRDFIIFFSEKKFLNIQRLVYLIQYLFLLLKEIIVANFQVAKIVLSRELKISPKVVKFKTKLKNDLTKTILANSITLTPGTLSIQVNDDEFIVHCLLEEYEYTLIDSKFEKILLKIEE